MIGLEKEFFLLDENGIPQIIPSQIPMDESGILAEARGKPSESGVEAVYLLMAATRGVQRAVDQYNKANGTKLVLDDFPYRKIDRKTRIELSRRFTKPISKFQNLYGFDSHRNSHNEQAAGIHVSFTEQRTVETKEGKTTYNQLFDFPTIMRKLDVTFKDEIKAAKRRAGFYEVKSDGRVEYRSLPSNTSLDKLTEFFEKEGRY